MNIESWYKKNHQSFERKFFDTGCLKDIYQTYLDTVHEHCPSLLSGSKVFDGSSSGFRIVNAGMMNSGKSSLFNSLLGSDVFAVQDVRCTQKNKTADWDNGASLTDTPGLGANESDTSEAYESFRQADLIVFVHVADKGGLTMEEIRFINDLKKILGEDLQKRLVIVLSKIDNSAISRDTDAVSQIIREISGNLSQEAGVAGVRVFPVSNSRYQKGTRENKEVLVQKSGVPELIAYIRDFRKKYRKDPYFDALQNGKNALLQFCGVFERLPLAVQLSSIESFKRKTDAVIRKISCYEKDQSDALDALSSLLSAAGSALGSSWSSSNSLNDVSRQFNSHDFHNSDDDISDQEKILSDLASELPERTASWSTVPAMKDGIRKSLKARKGMLESIQCICGSIHSIVQMIESNQSPYRENTIEMLERIFDVNKQQSISRMVRDLGD